MSRRQFLLAWSPVLLTLAACSAAYDAPSGETTGASTSALLLTSRVVNATTGDFNDDGYADFADHASSGQFWVHANLKNGSFAPQGSNQGQGQTATGSTWDAFVGDFNGDGYADFADHADNSSQFWIHLNNKNGTFNSANWGQGTTATGAGWEVLIADFTGDGYADYADHSLASGQFWIHENLKNGTFSGANWGQGTTASAGGWEVLVGDFNGDHFADYADHDQATGAFWVHLNNKNGTFNGANYAQGTTATGAGWETLTGDFDGDGYADFADHYVPSGQFWYHSNQRNGTFSAEATSQGHGQTATGSGWTILGKTSSGSSSSGSGSSSGGGGSSSGGSSSSGGTVKCGNGICEAGETCASCFTDCAQAYTICEICTDDGTNYPTQTSAAGCSADDAANRASPSWNSHCASSFGDDGASGSAYPGACE